MGHIKDQTDNPLASDDAPDDTALWTAFHVGLILLAFCIFMSNLLVLVAIIKCKHLHVPINIFVASMVLSDVLFGAFGMPARVVIELHLEMDPSICHFINHAYRFFLDISQLLLLTFTSERLYAIFFPSRHYEVRCKDAMICISVVWVIGLVVAVISNYIGYTENGYEHPYCDFTAIVFQEYKVYIVYFFIYLGTLVVYIGVNSYLILGQRKRKLASTDPSTDLGRKKDRKSEIVGIGVTSVYLICSLPVNIYDLFWHHGYPHYETLNRVLVILYYLNSLFNPIIYAVTNNRMMTACINVILSRPMNHSSVAETITHSQTPSIDKSPLGSTGLSEAQKDAESMETLNTERATSTLTETETSDIEPKTTLKAESSMSSFFIPNENSSGVDHESASVRTEPEADVIPRPSVD